MVRNRCGRRCRAARDGGARGRNGGARSVWQRTRIQCQEQKDHHDGRDRCDPDTVLQTSNLHTLAVIELNSSGIACHFEGESPATPPARPLASHSVCTQARCSHARKCITQFRGSLGHPETVHAVNPRSETTPAGCAPGGTTGGERQALPRQGCHDLSPDQLRSRRRIFSYTDRAFPWRFPSARPRPLASRFRVRPAVRIPPSPLSTREIPGPALTRDFSGDETLEIGVASMHPFNAATRRHITTWASDSRAARARRSGRATPR